MRQVWFHLAALLAVSGTAVDLVLAEDVQLRTRAVQLMNGAQAAALMHNTAPFIRTEVTFTGTAEDGSLKSGSYVRTRIPGGSLREQLRFGDWQSTSLFVDRTVSTTGGWDFPPFAVRRLFGLVPFRVGQFDQQDVVRDIRDGSADGQQAICVDYDTVHGERRSANHLCLSKTDGTLLTVQEEDRTYDYSRYVRSAGALLPQHIEYREGSDFSLSVDIKVAELDTVPDDTFLTPKGVATRTYCTTWTPPIPLHTPQPESRGGPDAAVTDVPVALYIRNDGTVADLRLVRPGRHDLGEEALQLVRSWTFRPATCNGGTNTVPEQVVVHFQGR